MDRTAPPTVHEVNICASVEVVSLIDAAFSSGGHVGATALHITVREIAENGENPTLGAPSPENNYTPQPTHDLHFPQNELAATLKRGDLWPVVGARSAFTIPERPGVVVRIDPLSRFIQGNEGCPPSIEQGREHLRHYEQELDKLYEQGIAVLRRTTRLQENDDGTVMLLTAVEQHTAPKTLLHESLDPDKPVTHATASLGVLRMVAQYFTTSEQPIRGIAHEKAITTDGTLLDYDPYICSPSDHYEAYKHMLVWCQSLSDDAGQEIPLMHLADFLAQRFTEATMRRTF